MMRALKIRMCRVSLMSASVAAIAVAAATPAVAQAQVRSFDIPAQPLSSALLEFSRQSDVLIVVAPELTNGRRAPALRGSLPVNEAIARLLRGSGLRATPNPRGGYRIERNGRPSQETSAAAADGPTASAAVAEESETIVVTGTNIRGAAPVGASPTVITRAQIEQSGHGRLQDLLEEIPQNFTGVSEDFSQANTQNLNRGTEIQLRGLGPGTTLTLVNGQRLAGGGAYAAFTDISTIPTAAIERVEILADGASAIYGSDAIGGVVNIILRSDYDGAESRFRVSTSGGEAEEFQMAHVFGRSWSSGNFILGYQFSTRRALQGGDRPYTATSGDLRRFGGSDFRTTLGSPGNILARTGSTVAFAIPTGQDGRNLTPGRLLPGAINYRDTTYVDILPEQDTHLGFFHFSQELVSDLKLNADFRYGLRDVTAVGLSETATITVPVTNPFYINPFPTPGSIRVNYDFLNDFGPIVSRGTSESITGNIGLELRLPSEWRAIVTGSFARETIDWRRNRIDQAARTLALNDTNPTTALNVFGDGGDNNPATIARLTRFDADRSESIIWSVGGIADGPLIELPGGSARVAVGVDYRDEQFDYEGNFPIAQATSSTRRVFAAFGELNLPLIGRAQNIPGIQRLELSAAVRYDDYSDAGSTWNPRFGVRWMPFEQLQLRGTWGTSYRAPPFNFSNTVIRPGFAGSGPVAAPGGGTITAIQFLGTVPDLTEETAETWTAGFDLEPVDGLSISATYFDIDYRNKIQSPGAAATILANPTQFPDNLILNPTQAEVDAICLQPDYEGTCNGIGAIIDLRIRNLSVVRVRGMDFSASYTFATPIGEFSPRVSGTYTFNYEQAVTDTSPLLDVVDTVGNPLALRLRGGLGWRLDGWSANADVIHAGAYRNIGTTPATPIDGWTTVNASLAYEFGDSAGRLAGTRLRLSATNLFDKLPPFVNVPGGYDAANGNVIGRTVSLQLTREW